MRGAHAFAHLMFALGVVATVLSVGALGVIGLTAPRYIPHGLIVVQTSVSTLVVFGAMFLVTRFALKRRP